MKAQTATEYLIIIAVVIIIALIVVSTLGSITGIGQGDSSALLKYRSWNPISISSWSATEYGTLITITNNGPDVITFDRFETGCLNISSPKILAAGEKWEIAMPDKFSAASLGFQLIYSKQEFTYTAASDNPLRQCTGLLSTLVAYYQGNDFSDSSRFKSSVSVVNSPTIAGGTRGNGYKFGGIQDRIDLADNRILDFNQSNFTVSSWAILTSNYTLNTACTGLPIISNDDFGWYLGLNNTGFALFRIYHAPSNASTAAHQRRM
jgi:hypothetical protein